MAHHEKMAYRLDKFFLEGVRNIIFILHWSVEFQWPWARWMPSQLVQRTDRVVIWAHITSFGWPQGRCGTHQPNWGRNQFSWSWSGINALERPIFVLRKGFIKSRLKYGSSQLAKVGTEDGSGLYSLFDYCQHIIELMTYKIRNRWCARVLFPIALWLWWDLMKIRVDLTLCSTECLM